MAGLSTLIWATQGWAETTIATATTAPVFTSTASSGNPDNVTITAEGSVNPGSGMAVTLDSDNQINNAGTIQIQDASDAIGVLVLGGHAGTLTNNLAITVNETTVAVDGDSDGDLDGSFATGARRYGVRVTGPAAFLGDLTNNTTGAITVQGDDSAGVSVETALQGTLSNLGAISVLGSRSYGVRTTGEVGGDILTFGSVSATGEAAQGIAVGGDVAGGVVVQGAVTATGYRSVTRSTDATVLGKLDADDLLQGGPALSISGSVARGLLIDAPPADLDINNADEDGDGTADASEGTGGVYSYGAAPGVVIGAMGRDVSLGNVGTGSDAYGVVIKGGVSGSGVYDGVSATGLQIGVAGGGAVSTGGGVRVGGSVAASSYGADATGLRIGGGASVPAIHNDGTISAGVVAEGLASAQAVLIDVGANAPLLQNAGAITATLSGEKGDAVAILDRSGTLAIIDNIHTISAAILPNDDANDTDDADTSASNELVTGKAVAIDVSANTSGVYVRQYDSSGGISPPSITGAIRLGAGADRMDVLGGSVRGDVAFGAGANALTIDGGATVTGAITAQGGTLALTVRSGSLSIVNTGALALSSLDLTAASNLVVTVDPASGAVTTLDVAGVAHIESGAKIGLNLTSLLKGSATYTIIRADSLTAGVIDQSLLGETPYLYTSALSASPVAGTVTLSLARKSADQLGLPAATRSAYEPMVAAIDRDSGLRGAMLGETGRAGFLGAYNQLLPNHSGAIFQLLAASAEANSGPIDERRGPDGGAWAQELNYRLQGDGGADVPGYRAWGLGLVGGYERVLPGLGVVGLTVGLNSGQVDPKGSADNQKLTVNMMEGGGYWRATWGGFSANARVAGDYLHVASDRVVSVSDGGVPFVGQADGRWNGLAVTSRAQAGYEAFLGPVYLRPQVAVDYLRLREGGYAEQGSSAALNLTVDSRTSSQLSAFAGLALGALFGEERNWGPELLVGYRRVANETLGSTQARFTSGGDSFVLGADEVGGQGFAAHLSFRGENGFGGFAVQSGAEMRDGLAVYDFRLSAHLLF